MQIGWIAGSRSCSLPFAQRRGGPGRGKLLLLFLLGANSPKSQCAGANPSANEANTGPACSCDGAALAKACW